MKATLQFNLGDHSERLEHKRALNGTNAYLVIFSLQMDTIRKIMKYENINDSQRELLDRISSDLFGYLEKYDININDLE